MEQNNNPELHINEEPRDDFQDTAMGFAGMFTFMIVVAIIATVIKLLMR